ncbi:uncharacterized protein MELLADRAFT_115444 [Melampsora larici-populina 98AG31]|uniref:Uncharacterized protein n=1 Tax=Melampsora larici-populina (strain 98AG31 / pathotype 3-4-7) TaxID=747676 RepID=F4RAL2_MELLP|nr:uncharacterized protein MELLADRAFT_115444 [Melampsora larici-populina 98AG31]EGG10762.1 hypothetical protein MELLADRAFT_115444 [Melampsora larici-populina 98AG31]
MLDPPVTLTRPLPPARKSFSNRINPNSTKSTIPSSDSTSPIQSPSSPIPISIPTPTPKISQLNTSLSDSPLNVAARLLQQNLLPTGTVDFNGCGSFAEAWSQETDEPVQPTSTTTTITTSLPPDFDHQLNDDDDDLQDSPKPITLEWVNAKTREELENLLLAADRVIRERERDLGIAASIGKSLLENNIALRARQESLLAQHASSPPTSRIISRRTDGSEYIEGRPPPSPHNTVTNLANERDTRSDTPIDTFRFPTKTLNPHHDHRRHSTCSSISSITGPTQFRITPNHLNNSPSILNRLSEQNEALAGELAALEAETSASEQKGKRRLRKLVKELDSLREELRATEERNRLLEEERAQIAFLAANQRTTTELPRPSSSVLNHLELEHHNMERIQHTMNHRNEKVNLACEDGNVDHILTEDRNIDEPIIKFSHQKTLSHASSIMSLDDTTIIASETNSTERALVSQLLSKISELEESQQEFDEERLEMKFKLNKARDEVESLKKQVDEVEEELKEVRELDGINQRGLIGWKETDDDHDHDHGSSPNWKGKLLKKAPGNRKMIENRKKYRKRHWPAVEHHSASISSENDTPDSRLSIDSHTFYREESPSPSMRGRPLSFTLTHADADEDEHQHQRRILRTLGHIPSATPSIGSSEEGDHSLRLRAPPAQIGRRKTSLSQQTWADEEPEESEEDDQNQTPSPTRPPTRLGYPDSGLQLSVQSKSDDESQTYLERSRFERSMNEMESYDELQRAVAELPVAWADDDEIGQPETMLLINDSKQQQQGRDPKSLKSETNEWVYEVEDSDLEETNQKKKDLEDPWKSTRYPSHRISNQAHLNLEKYRRHYRVLLGKGPNRPLPNSSSDDERSTVSNSHTHHQSSSDRNSSVHEPNQGPLRSPRMKSTKRKVSRRERALRRLGMEGVIDEERTGSTLSSSSSGSSSSEEESENSEEDEGGSVEEDSSWDYIDQIDHESRLQGKRGTDYYPMTIKARNSPGMIATRLQVTSQGWRTFVYQWVKLVGVIGFAVSWAVWQGPKKMLGDGQRFDDDDEHDDEGEQDGIGFRREKKGGRKLIERGKFEKQDRSAGDERLCHGELEENLETSSGGGVSVSLSASGSATGSGSGSGSGMSGSGSGMSGSGSGSGGKSGKSGNRKKEKKLAFKMRSSNLSID